MTIILRIAWHELLGLFRSQTLRILAVVLLVLVSFCLVTGQIRYRHVQQQRRLAIQMMRQQFLNQGAVNPHTAAHFGHFVFKPHSFLNVLDPGIEQYVGVSLRLEGHQQNEAMFAPSQNQSSLIRLGELSFILLLQIIFPLLIIFVCHQTVVQERLGGTLKLLAAQGVSMRQLVWGKIVGYGALVGGTLLLCAGGFALLLPGNGTMDTMPDQLIRITLFLLLYGFYYFLLIALTVYLSAIASAPGSVLIGMLSAWFFFTIVLPKAAANVGDQTAPLISKLTFEQRIADANRNGLNGHDPQDKRVKRLEDSLLTHYRVDSLRALPINADGIVMQADEYYHNQLYDNEFMQLKQTIRQQNRVSSYAGFMAPFLAVRNVSMTLAETDVEHHFRFTEQAEQYRRRLIKKLNDEFAYGGSKTGDWEWKVSENYWQAIADFQYPYPTLAWSLQYRQKELMALLLWLVVVLGLIQLTTNRITFLE